MALEHLKVIDLSTLGPGNFATMYLGDFGADVVIIAPPPESDARVSVSSYAKGMDSDSYIWSMANALKVLHESLNRNKKSMTLNLKSPEGRAVFYELAKKSDIILDGFRPGVTERLGIGFETIRELNPGIIYCSMSGYGHDGPHRDLPGHDINFTAMAGGTYMVGEAGGPPVTPMNVFADWNASLHAIVGILTALAVRQQTGRGQFIEVTYLESAISVLNTFYYDYLNYGTIYKRGETFYNGVNPFYDVYQTKDGEYITIGCNEPAFWANLCRNLDKEEYIPYQFAQGEKKQEITSWLRDTFLSKTRDEWFDFLKDKNVPIGKVYSNDEVFTDPHIVSRGIVKEIDHPIRGKVKHIGIPFKLSETPGKLRNAAPELGQDTANILSTILGYSEETINSYKEQRII